MNLPLPHRTAQLGKRVCSACVTSITRIALIVLAFCAHPEVVRASIEMTDDIGTRVKLKQPATRIISLAPHVTELLFAVGAGDLTVGVVEHSDFPAAAKSIPRVGSAKSVSAEALLALRPDLVIAWHSGNGAETIARLRKLGLTVFANEPRSVVDIASALRQFGQLAGTNAHANAAADAFMATLEELEQRFRNSSTLSVFYQVWDQPLITLNGRHIISDVIRLCGGRNVFADALPIAPQIGVESVLQRDPDVIIASGMGEARPDWLDRWQAWPSLKATREGHLYFVPPDLLQRHSPRILQGAALMCERMERARK